MNDRAIPVLLYHAVSDVTRPGLERWTVSPEIFADHVERVARCGRVPITIPQLAAGLRGDAPLPDRAVAVTFDDGYDDTLPAVQLLAAHGIPSTVYVTVSALGTSGMLTADQVRELVAIDGVCVGAHGMTHRRLDELDGPDVAHELVASRRCVEEVTGRACTSFAYPHGAHDRQVVAAVAAAGYDSAAAVKNALSHGDDDPLAIARVTIESRTSATALDRVLAGDAALVPRRERLRTSAYRLARRTRRRVLTRTGVR